MGDIVVGTVLPPGSQRAMECRMAAFYAGFPGTWPFSVFLSSFSYHTNNAKYLQFFPALRDSIAESCISCVWSLEEFDSSPVLVFWSDCRNNCVYFNYRSCLFWN